MTADILMGCSTKQVRELISSSVKKVKDSKPKNLRVDMFHRNLLESLVQSLRAFKQAKKRSRKDETDNGPAKKVAKRGEHDVAENGIVSQMNFTDSTSCLENSQTRTTQQQQ